MLDVAKFGHEMSLQNQSLSIGEALSAVVAGSLQSSIDLLSREDLQRKEKKITRLHATVQQQVAERAFLAKFKEALESMLEGRLHRGSGDIKIGRQSEPRPWPSPSP